MVDGFIRSASTTCLRVFGSVSVSTVSSEVLRLLPV